MEENRKHMESLESKINQAKSAGQELAYVLGEAGLKSAYGAVLDVVTTFTKGVSESIEKGAEWKFGLILLGGAVSAYTLGIIGASVATKSFTAAVNASIARVYAFNRAILTNPLGLLATGLIAVSSAWVYYNGRQKEAREEFEKMSKSVDETNGKLKEIEQTLNTIGGTTQQNVFDYEESIKQLDELKKKIIEVQEARVKKDPNSKMNNLLAEQVLPDEIPQELKDIASLVGVNVLEFEKWDDAIAEVNNKMKQMQQTTDKLKQNDFNSIFDDNNKKINMLNDLIEDMNNGREITAERARNIIETEAEMAKAIDTSNGSITFRKDVIDELIEKYDSEVDKAVNFYEREVESQKSTLMQKLTMYGIEMQSLADLATLKQQVIAKTEEMNNQGFQGPSIAVTMLDDAKLLEENIDKLEAYKDIVKTLGKKGQFPSDAEKDYDNLQKSIDSSISNLDSLADAYKTLSEGKSLSPDQLLDLVANHKEIAEYISLTNDATLKSGEIAKVVFEIKKNALLAELELEKQKLDVQIKSIALLNDNWAAGSAQQADAQKRYDEIKKQLDAINASMGLIGELSLDDFNDDTEEAKDKLDKLNEELEQHNFLIKQAESALSKYAKGSKDYIKSLENQIKLHKEKKKLIEEEIKNIDKQLVQGTKTVSVTSTVPTSTNSTSTSSTDSSSLPAKPNSLKGLKGQSLINALAPYAMELQNKYGIPASVTLGQFIQESGVNRVSGLAANYNNLFGVKAGASWTGKKVSMDTWEEVNGKKVAQKALFKVYDSLEEAFEDRAKLLMGSRYTKYTNGVTDPNQYIKGIHKAGYATDSNYSNAIINHINKYGLTQFDQNAGAYENFNTKINSSTTSSTVDSTQEVPLTNDDILDLKRRRLDYLAQGIDIDAVINDLILRRVTDIADNNVSGREQVERSIQTSQYRMNKYDPNSESYRKEIDNQIYYNELMQESALLEEKYLRNQLKNNKELTDAHKQEIQKRIDELLMSWQGYADDINSLQLDKFESRQNEIIDNTDKKLKLLDNSIGNIEDEIDSLDQDDKNYISNKSELIAKLKDKYEEQKTEINQTIQSLKGLSKELSVGSDAWKSNQDQIEQWTDKLESVDDASREASKNLVDLRKDLANDIIDIYKDVYEKQKDIALDAIEELDKAEEERHKTATENIEKEYEDFEESINKRLALIDEQASEEDYNKQLTKTQKEAQDIQNKLNVLSLDDSIEAKAQREELEKEHKEKLEEIEEMQNDRSKDLRKKNLQGQLDAYKKDVDKKKDAEDDKYDAAKKSLEKEKEATEQKFEDLINDEREFARIREEVMAGNLSNIEVDFKEFETFLDGNMKTIGQSISLNLIDKLKEAIIQAKLLQQIPINSGGFQYNDHDGDGEGDFDEFLGGSDNLTDAIGNYQDAVNNGSYTPSAPYTGENYDPETDHEGGIVGRQGNKDSKFINKLFNLKPDEQIVKALKGEVVINPNIGMPNFVTNLQNLLSKVQLPNLSLSGAGGNTYQFDFHIGSINNKKDADYFADRVIKGVKLRGGDV